MLGRRKKQQTFFDVIGLPHTVAPDTFYGRMGGLSNELFRDEDLKEMYCDDHGRPSLPPSLMCGITLLQFHDDVSDGEAVERCLYDLRWKVALHLSLDYAGFHPSSLSVFRSRLATYGKERYAFDRFIQVGRAVGFIPDKVTLLIDTTWVKGAGAVQDTYTLIRKSVRKLLKAMGYHMPGKRQGCGQEIEGLLGKYVDQDRRAEIDWEDPQQRQAELKILVADAEAVLDLAVQQADDEEVRSLGWMLSKILGDDVELDKHGQPQIGEGTAPDRIISTTDPQMRHGRKSASRRFDGYKVSVATEETSELILDIADIPASSGDGQELMPTIERVEEHADVKVERALGDGAYGSGANRAACAERMEAPVDLVSPMRRPADPEVDKSAFTIDWEGKTATCPTGHTVPASAILAQAGRLVLKFAFPRPDCETCRLFDRCVHSQENGRSLTTSPYETYLRDTRERQKTEAFQLLYRKRCRVEGKQSELVSHGLRETRYLEEGKRQFQRLWIAAAVNLKRLFKLADTRQVSLETVLRSLNAGQRQALPA
jgi:transposase